MDSRAVKLILETFDSFLCNAELNNLILQKVEYYNSLFSTALDTHRLRI
jgi:hypothetical protein